MLSFPELKTGAKIIFDNQPHEIIEHSLMFKGRGHSTLAVKLRNLLNGNVISQTFHPSDSFEEAEIEKIKARFLYQHREKYIFCEEDNPSFRFELIKEAIGSAAQFLKSNQPVEGIKFKEKIINIALPIKVQLKVVEAPPGVKGERAQAGTKQVTLETGAIANAPLFIETGDTIEINTETGEYVRRVE
jgi:elongation factor P